MDLITNTKRKIYTSVYTEENKKIMDGTLNLVRTNQERAPTC